MNKEEVIRLFNKEQRIEIEYPSFRREEAGRIIRQVSLTDHDGYISYSELDHETADEVIREQVAYFQELGQQFEWKVYDYDQPENLKEKLQALGFKVDDPEALMIIQLRHDHPLLCLTVPTNIHRITDDAGIDDIISLEEEIYGQSYSGLGASLKRDQRNDPENLLIYAFYDKGRAVSAAWMYLHKGTSFGSLWGGTSLPEYRQKGLYTALIAVRAQTAWHRGFRFLTVDASPMSRPILERKGFEFFGFSYPCLSPK